MRFQYACLTVTIAAVCAFAPLDLPAAENRLSGPIDRNSMVVLHGDIHPLARPEFAGELLDPATNITGISLDLQPTAAQQAALETFLEQQRDPSSPDYRRWLTPQEFADRFGLSEADIANLASWLTAQGFHIEHTGEARNWILFSGSAGQIARAFHTSLRYYFVDGEQHFANENIPSVPAALSGIVGGIRGLDDFRPRPSRSMRAVPHFTSGSSHYLAPDDLAAIYNTKALYQAGVDGTGMKLVIAGQTDVNLSDLRSFRSNFGLPAKDPQIVLAGADPGTSQNDLMEAELDLQWAGAVARNATVIYVNSNNVFTSVQDAVNQNLAPVISLSYGSCEIGAPSSYRSIAQQASAQGITWMTASGDTGAAACDYGAQVASHGPSVSFPADIPEVVAVGGTEFAESGGAGWSSTNGSALASVQGYLPEEAWNDSGSSLASGGGGISTLFTKPWWQAGPGVPADGQRDVPDVSLTASGAHDGYLVYLNGSLMVVGGTSAASPSFAGMVTLLNHYLVVNGILSSPGLGNLNPSLYALAQNTTDVFHDITSGNNIVSCVRGTTGCSTGSFGYSAGPGYDLATGLGSVDAYKMATEWNNLQSAVGTTTAVTANATNIASTASTTLTATVTPVSGANAPTGSVAFTAGGVKLATASLTAGSATAATATASVAGSALATGANTITATYTPTGAFRNSSSSATVTVAGPPQVNTTTTLTSSIASLPPALPTLMTSSVAVFTVFIAPATGTVAPTGSVTLTAGNSLLATAAVVASAGQGKATFLLKGTAFPLGTVTVTASYTATGNFANSSGAVSITVAKPPVLTRTALAASPASLGIGDSTTLTATVSPTTTGSGSPIGTVTFLDGGVSIGTATLSSSGAAATASITLASSTLNWGSNSITATYSGDASTSTTFNGSASAATQVSVTSATTMQVTSSLSTLAQTSVSVVTVTMQAASGKAPTGRVTLTSGTFSASANLAAGAGSSTATFQVRGSSLAVGQDTLAVSYAQTTLFLSSGGTVDVTVLPPPVSTTVIVATNPQNIDITGSSVLTAAVSPVKGTVAPIGTVTFYAGTLVLGSQALTAAGSSSTASIVVPASALTWGSNAITAKYGGDTSTPTVVNPSTSVATPLNVTSATTMTVTTSAATVAQTGTAIITATLSAASGKAPTGSVRLTSGSLTLTSSLRAGAGSSTATFLVKGSSLAIGSNTLSANYAATTLFQTSQGTVDVTALPPPVTTSTLLAVSAEAIGIADSETLTATVTPATGTVAPIGTVNFYSGTVLLGSQTLTASGSTGIATLTLPATSLIWGSNTITAKYSGDTSTPTVVVPSTSPAVTVSVSSLTTITVTSSLSTIAPSAISTVTVTIRAASGKAPTGAVTLTSGNLTMTASLRPGSGLSTAVFLVKGSVLAAGSDTLTATCAGTALFVGSQGTLAVTAQPVN